MLLAYTLYQNTQTQSCNLIVLVYTCLLARVCATSRNEQEGEEHEKTGGTIRKTARKQRTIKLHLTCRLPDSPRLRRSPSDRQVARRRVPHQGVNYHDTQSVLQVHSKRSVDGTLNCTLTDM